MAFIAGVDVFILPFTTSVSTVVQSLQDPYANIFAVFEKQFGQTVYKLAIGMQQSGS